MHSMWGAQYNTLAVYLAATLAAGCSAEAQGLQTAPSTSGQAGFSAMTIRQNVDSRCTQFAANFDQVIACQRADGTLNSFVNQQIAWRVRYFVRYMQMPCGEMPTVQEGYAFHMVIDDLDADKDLNATQRDSIRYAMYDGKPHCQ